jgi:hypothetical protein
MDRDFRTNVDPGRYGTSAEYVAAVRTQAEADRRAEHDHYLAAETLEVNVHSARRCLHRLTRRCGFRSDCLAQPREKPGAPRRILDPAF